MATTLIVINSESDKTGMGSWNKSHKCVMADPEHRQFRGLIVVPFGQDETLDEELRKAWAPPRKSDAKGHD